MGAYTIVEIPAALSTLFKTANGIDELIESGCPYLPQHDFHIPLASIPVVLNTRLEDIPAETPYLDSPVLEQTSRIRSYIQKHRKNLSIGIVWSGNPKHVNDRNRSCPLENFSTLSHLPGIQLFSLQKEIRKPEDREIMMKTGIEDLSFWLQDFGCTAAAIDEMDLVISVDTSVVHLAGALNKPTWLLLPFAPDWRWMLERPDSPWYPSFTLLRQKSIGDWKSVFRQLEALIQANLEP
jgi:hypothetical protein